jgi:predicted permease
MLLVGAGLLARTLRQLQTLRLGYTPQHLAIAELTIPDFHSDTLPQFSPVYDVLAPRLAAIPGVKSVTRVLEAPFNNLGLASVWEIEGQSQAQGTANPMVALEMGDSGYFRTLGIPVLRGRGFLATDQGNASQVTVVSEAAARLFWPGQDPIGKRLRLAHTNEPWNTVIGVAADIRYRSLRQTTPTVFAPWRPKYWQGAIALRTTTDIVGLAPAIRRAVAEVDPEVTLWQVQSMDDYLAQPLAQPRLSATLLSAFGLTALILAAIGLYGVMASLVREQTRDIGVRIALGATPSRVRREVMIRAFAVSASGAAFGLMGALITSRFLRSLLFKVSPADPMALGGACVTLLGVAVLAAYIPARYASRVDPARVLQTD